MKVAKTLTLMSGKKFLLDTNILIAFFKKERSIIEHLRKGTDVLVPIVTLGELYFGAEKSEHRKSNIEKIVQLADIIPVVNCDRGTARVYGEVKNYLKSKGAPIPENDVWIASIAIQHNFILVTRDKHFKQVKDLTLVEW